MRSTARRWSKTKWPPAIRCAAGDFLEQAYREQPNEAYISVLGMNGAFATSGKGIRGAEVAAWFGRALSAECDCLDAFDVWNCFHQPRWGGSYDDIIALGCDDADAQRSDARLAQVLWLGIEDVIEDSMQGGDENAMRRALDSPLVRVATAKLVKELRQHGSPGAALDCRWQYCSYLWHAGSRAEARVLAATLPADSLNPEIERRFHVPVSELLAGSAQVGGGGF